ncbi:hypothetical protein [Miltoncostaea oceani]|uniref:hypothetical protein n=1 Tax=Miltoncostaea oceani TaxID=2843216 RepID=UPI001C3CFBDA|nr:hypothetical protein [Miltoncostaea oceani]
MSDRDDILRRWRQGEERLYPVATVRPDLYEAVVGVVRALADHLSTVPDLDALVITFRTAGRDDELRAAGVRTVELSPEIDLDLVRDAAYQVRARELSMRASSERTGAAIRRARAAGETTAVIWAEGERELWPPYRRVEMSVSTGRAVAVSTAMDPDTMTPRYALEGIALDPGTGEALDAEPIAPRREFSDPDEWRAAAAALRESLLTS